MVELFIFKLFSILSIIFSFCVVFLNNPVYSIFALIVVFVFVINLLIFLGAEFLAILFLIVYVGAIGVLFLFVIMMLNVKIRNLNFSLYRYLLFSLFFIFLSFLILINLRILNFFYITCDNNFLNYFFIDFYFSFFYFSNAFNIGYITFCYYSPLFLISGILLLVSMIGVLCLTLHRRNDIKRQFIYKQIQSSFSSHIKWKNF